MQRGYFLFSVRKLHESLKGPLQVCQLVPLFESANITPLRCLCLTVWKTLALCSHGFDCEVQHILIHYMHSCKSTKQAGSFDVEESRQRLDTNAAIGKM